VKTDSPQFWHTSAGTLRTTANPICDFRNVRVIKCRSHDPPQTWQFATAAREAALLDSIIGISILLCFQGIPIILYFSY